MDSLHAMPEAQATTATMGHPRGDVVAARMLA